MQRWAFQIIIVVSSDLFHRDDQDNLELLERLDGLAGSGKHTEDIESNLLDGVSTLKMTPSMARLQSCSEDGIAQQ
jgi:hypothetical protein